MDTLSIYSLTSEGIQCSIKILGEDIDPDEVNECLRLLAARGCKRVSIIVVGSAKASRVLDSLRPVIKGCITLTLGVWMASSVEEAMELERMDLGELYA